MLILLKTASEPTRKAIYENKIAPPGEKPHFISLEEGVNRLRKVTNVLFL